MRYFSMAAPASTKLPRNVGGLGQQQRLRPPQRDHQLSGDDQAAHGDEDLAQVRAIDAPHDDPLEAPADGPAHHRGRRHRREQREQVQHQAVGRHQPDAAPSTVTAM